MKYDGGRQSRAAYATKDCPTVSTHLQKADPSRILLPMRVGKLLHTRYRVNDLDKTVKFYKDVLGLEETRRHKSPRGSELVFMKAPGSEELIELCYFSFERPVQSSRI